MEWRELKSYRTNVVFLFSLNIELQQLKKNFKRKLLCFLDKHKFTYFGKSWEHGSLWHFKSFVAALSWNTKTTNSVSFKETFQLAEKRVKTYLQVTFVWSTLVSVTWISNAPFKLDNVSEILARRRKLVRLRCKQPRWMKRVNINMLDCYSRWKYFDK